MNLSLINSSYKVSRLKKDMFLNYFRNHDYKSINIDIY